MNRKIVVIALAAVILVAATVVVVAYAGDRAATKPSSCAMGAEGGSCAMGGGGGCATGGEGGCSMGANGGPGAQGGCAMGATGGGPGEGLEQAVAAVKPPLSAAQAEQVKQYQTELASALAPIGEEMRATREQLIAQHAQGDPSPDEVSQLRVKLRNLGGKHRQAVADFRAELGKVLTAEQTKSLAGLTAGACPMQGGMSANGGTGTDGQTKCDGNCADCTNKGNCPMHGAKSSGGSCPMGKDVHTEGSST